MLCPLCTTLYVSNLFCRSCLSICLKKPKAVVPNLIFPYFCGSLIMKNFFLLLALTISFLYACNSGDKRSQITEKDTTAVADSAVNTVPEPVEEQKPSLTYSFIKKKEWQALKDSFDGAGHLDILNAINRVDSVHLKRLDSILVPSDYSYELKDYLPFPSYVDGLKDVNKIIFFSNPAQVFAAYENGTLILTGPTSTGRKDKKTPPRLYFTNWKSRRSISTSNDEWILYWNFNVHNFWGVGFHQYALPGYPASHSCMRLQEHDAKFLYNWAEQWRLQNDQVIAHGTPVIVFGRYPFGQPRPWHKLIENPNQLTLTADSLKQYYEPHLEEIMKKQQQRITVVNNN